MFYTTLAFSIFAAVVAQDCPCGWKLEDTGEVFTHRIFNDFSQIPDIKNLTTDSKAAKNSDNPNIRLNTKYDAENVQTKDRLLHMVQKAYTDLNLDAWDPVSIAGIQTRATDILHGTFRTELKLEGYDGGSCASFFWYHDDAQELDIEVVTPGTSIVNDTINYTTQPSVNADWSRIPGATLSLPLQSTMSEFRTHRFDCDSKEGVKYYLDDKLVHSDKHNLPREGGSLQLKLWADGNKWWSGMPSKTEVRMHVKSIVAYFNTTSSLTDEKWHNICARARSQKPCKAVFSTEPEAKDYAEHCKQNPRICSSYPTATISSGVTILPLNPTGTSTTSSPRLITSTSRPTSGAKKVRPVPYSPPYVPYTWNDSDRSYKISNCLLIAIMVCVIMAAL